MITLRVNGIEITTEKASDAAALLNWNLGSSVQKAKKAPTSKNGRSPRWSEAELRAVVENKDQPLAIVEKLPILKGRTGNSVRIAWTMARNPSYASKKMLKMLGA